MDGVIVNMFATNGVNLMFATNGVNLMFATNGVDLGSSPCRVKPKTLTLVFVASPLSIQH